MKENFYKDILDKLNSAVYVRDLDKRLIYMNEKAKLLSGFLPENTSFYRCYELFGDEDYKCVNECIIDKVVLQNKALKEMERKIRTKYVLNKVLEVSATPYMLNNTVAGAIVILKDITEQKQAEEIKIDTDVIDQSLSIYDKTTNSYNKSYLLERLNSEFLIARRYTAPLSVLMIEIDDFREIKKDYGQNYFFSLIKQLTGLLKGRLRRSDLVFRFSESQIAIILPYSQLSASLRLAEELKDKVRNEFSKGGETHTASIGAAEVTDKITSSYELIDRTLKCLEAAKNTGNSVATLQET
jgi:diguanylate cyclase (GGDEF)-like protein/PAS domain S-box-containing protein